MASQAIPFRVKNKKVTEPKRTKTFYLKIASSYLFTTILFLLNHKVRATEPKKGPIEII